MFIKTLLFAILFLCIVYTMTKHTHHLAHETFMLSSAFQPMKNKAIENAKPRIIKQQHEMVQECLEEVGYTNRLEEHQPKIDKIIDKHFQQMVGDVVNGG